MGMGGEAAVLVLGGFIETWFPQKALCGCCWHSSVLGITHMDFTSMLLFKVVASWQ